MTWKGAGALTQSPTAIAAMEPAITCPSAPMLKRPTRKAKPTDSPVRMIGMAWMMNSPM